MSRKDYIKLAAALRAAFQEEGLSTTSASQTIHRQHGVSRAVDAVADVLQADNSRFDRQRFMDAVYNEPKPKRARKPKQPTVRCNQCSAATINGLFCHETGCPNTNARYDAETDTWVKQRKCFECGCTVDADDPCCALPVFAEEMGEKPVRQTLKAGAR